MKINYIFFKFLYLTGLLTVICFSSGATEVRRSSMYTEKVLEYIAYIENQNNDKTEKAGGVLKNYENIDNAEDKENKLKASENNVFYADEWIKSWFIRLDRNDDKVVSKEEFMQSMEPFSIDGKHLAIFESREINHDGKLTLNEFQKFIDSTMLVSKNEIVRQEATITDDADDVDAIKLMAGVLAISLLMAAFRFV